MRAASCSGRLIHTHPVNVSVKPRAGAHLLQRDPYPAYLLGEPPLSNSWYRTPFPYHGICYPWILLALDRMLFLRAPGVVSSVSLMK